MKNAMNAIGMPKKASIPLRTDAIRDAVVEEREALIARIRDHLTEWLRAYPEDIFPSFTADTPDSALTRDRIAGQMGRHMATQILEWLDALARTEPT